MKTEDDHFRVMLALRSRASQAVRAMSTSAPASIGSLHKHHCYQKDQLYTDPATNFMVMTEVSHLTRGKCCGNRCRHCPFGWENVKSLQHLPLAERHRVCTGARGAFEGARVPVADIEDGGGQGLLTFITSGDKKACSAAMASWEAGPQPSDICALPPAATIAAAGVASSSKDVTASGLKSSVPFTRGGDGGLTSLPGGARVSKLGDVFDAMGAVDELCSFTGVAHCEIKREVKLLERRVRADKKDGVLESANHAAELSRLRRLENELFEAMQYLFEIGACVAARPYPLPAATPYTDAVPFPSALAVANLEIYITEETALMPPLRHFILPTGRRSAAALHVCRTVCRRAERSYLSYLNGVSDFTDCSSSSSDTDSARNPAGGITKDGLSMYLNRLSDFYFTGARVANHVGGGGVGGRKREVKLVGVESKGGGRSRATVREGDIQDADEDEDEDDEDDYSEDYSSEDEAKKKRR